MLVVINFWKIKKIMLTTDIIIFKVFIIPYKNSFFLLTMTASLGTCLLSFIEQEEEDIS